MTPSVAVIVSNYNTWLLAARCISAVKQFEPHVDVVLADDCSTQPSPSTAGALATLVQMPRNLGLAANLNNAVRTLSQDIIVLFDSDAMPLNSFTATVQDAFDTEDRLGALGFATEDQHGAPTECDFPAPTLAGFVLGNRIEGLLNRAWAARRPRCLILGALAFRRSAWLDIGAFDESLAFNDIDTDFCVRLHRAGWSLRVDGRLRAMHQGGGTGQSRTRRVVQLHRDRWRFLAKHSATFHPTAVRFALRTRWRLESFVLSLQAGRNPTEVTRARIADRVALLNELEKRRLDSA